MANGRVRIAGYAALAAVGMATAFGAAGASAAEASLVGTWSGSGSFKLSSGATEKARCKARYAKTGATSYEMSATCATSSAAVNQSATLIQTGANRYAGSWFNEQYGTGGSISITVSGGSQSVRLSGSAGAGQFSLRKR